MNDLKLDVYRQVLNSVRNHEKEEVGATICVLYAQKFANCMKEVHFFLRDDGSTFDMDYNVEYNIGEFQNSNCFIDTKELLDAFGFDNYEQLKNYFTEKYNDDGRAWHKIVQEMEEKGLSPNVDKWEGDSNHSHMTNII